MTIIITVMNSIKYNNYYFIQNIFLNNVPEEIKGYAKLDKILYYINLVFFYETKNIPKVLNKIDSKSRITKIFETLKISR